MKTETKKEIKEKAIKCGEFIYDHIELLALFFFVLNISSWFVEVINMFAETSHLTELLVLKGIFKLLMLLVGLILYSVLLFVVNRLRKELVEKIK